MLCIILFFVVVFCHLYSLVGSEAETVSLESPSAEQECSDQLKEHSNTPDAEDSFL